jgi:hypothetical protein
MAMADIIGHHDEHIRARGGGSRYGQGCHHQNSGPVK